MDLTDISLRIKFADPAKTWNPDSRVYNSRRLQQQRRAETTPVAVLLPQGFPAQINPASPLVWSGHTISSSTTYLRHWQKQDIKEIESALGRFKSLNLPRLWC